MSSTDFGIPKLPNAITRSYQMLSEQLSSSSDRTHFSQSTQKLFNELEALHDWCGKILEQLHAIVEPNPAFRISSNFKKLITKDTDDGKIPKSNQGSLAHLLDQGVSLIAPSGTNFGPELQNFATQQHAIGKAHELFTYAVKYEIIISLNTVALQLSNLRELKKDLEKKRLDVDYCKGRLRASSTANAIQSANTSLDEANSVFSADVDIFEKQCRTKLPVIQGELSAIAHQFTKVQHKLFYDCEQTLRGRVDSTSNSDSTDVNGNTDSSRSPEKLRSKAKDEGSASTSFTI